MKAVMAVLAGAMAVAAGGGCSPSGREQAEEAAERLSLAGQELGEAAEEVARSLDQGGQGLAGALHHVQEAVGAGGNADPVDFRDLKSALPAGLDGYTAGRAIGERTRVMGVATSQAEVRLSRDEGDGGILVRITDTGSVAGWAALAGRTAGAVIEVDRETETGFERSSVVDGVRTYESFDEAGGHSRIRLFYADRFAIDLEGEQVAWADMAAARDAVDLRRLDELAAATATATAPVPARE